MRSFDDTHEMSDAALRALLVTEDARSRIYAIWALGLRAMLAAPFDTQLAGEPDPGVRRALAVVLAGQGELDLVVALSRHDPDEHVRASVTRLVLRFAKSGHVPWSVVTERLVDRAAVRAAVLEEIDASDPAELHDLVVNALDDEDESVRRVAVEAAVKLHEANAIDGHGLARFFERASPAEVEHALSIWFAIGAPRAVARVLAAAPRPVRERALRLRPALAFTELVPLIEHDVELFESLQYPLSLKIRDAPHSLVLRAVARSPQYDSYVEEAVSRLAAPLEPPPDFEEVWSAIRTACTMQIAWIDERLTSPERMRYYEYDDDFEDLEAARGHLRAHRAALEALLRSCP